MKTLLGLTFALAGALTAASPGDAQEIGIQFVGDGTVLASNTTAGVVAQDNFNNVTSGSGMASNIFVDNTGSASNIAGFSLSSSGGSNSTTGVTGSTGFGELFSGGIQSVGPQTVTLSNIPYLTYDVYVYVDAASNSNFRGAEVSTNDTVDSSAQAYYYADFGSSASSYIQGTATVDSTAGSNGNTRATYVEFTNLTLADLTLTNSTTASNTFGASPGIVGIQIVDTAVVPEPSTDALTLAGVVTLILILRRRQGPVPPN